MTGEARPPIHPDWSLYAKKALRHWRALEGNANRPVSDFAYACQRATGTVAYWLTPGDGKRLPNCSSLEKMAEACGQSVCSLVLEATNGKGLL